MFTEKDKEQIRLHGLDMVDVMQQIENFKKGFPFADLAAAASAGKGIYRFGESDILKLERLFNEKSGAYRVIKFVPASGMASRMFKDLFHFCDHYKGDSWQLEAMQKQKEFAPAFSFIENLERFAFYQDLKKCISEHTLDFDTLLAEKSYNTIINFLLDSKGLDYAFLPKGLLKFHRYGSYSRTAIEEHLVEGANYCRNASGEVNLHFTLSHEHIELFQKLIREVISAYEIKFHCRYNIFYSIQSPSTDTIALNEFNEPFREDDGSLIFRKGGHGALLKNLDEMDAEIVFIKNIDNIVPDRLKFETYQYKKVIGGLLLHLQERVFSYLRKIETNSVTEDLLVEIEKFCRNELMLRLPDEVNNLELSEKAEMYAHILNRPIRVCGMVKNEGEPGGGPFWVKTSKGEISLQIVESSQIDQENSAQLTIFKTATHFNPVDLVCSLKNYKGEKFNLQKFVDPETGFISVKSHNGKQLKAQELPGLWNGAMANWLTVFVEVPIITFNPVKTVNDLLRSEHQA